MKQWYYAKDGQKNGPVDRATIQDLFDKKQISADDLIWEEGMQEWVRAGSIFQSATPNLPPPPINSIATPSAPPLPPPQPRTDHGNFLSWGIALVLIPYANAVVVIILAILICLEISAVQREIREGKLPMSTYGNLHPVAGFAMVFCCALIFYPILMHWRNQSGYFKPQPHAVWFSIMIMALYLIFVAVAGFLYFAIIMAAVANH